MWYWIFFSQKPQINKKRQHHDKRDSWKRHITDTDHRNLNQRNNRKGNNWRARYERGCSGREIRVLPKGDHTIKISLRLLNTSSFRSRFITNSKSLELVIEIITIYEINDTTQISILLLVHCIFFIYIVALDLLMNIHVDIFATGRHATNNQSIHQSLLPRHFAIKVVRSIFIHMMARSTRFTTLCHDSLSVNCDSSVVFFWYSGSATNKVNIIYYVLETTTITALSFT